ncbi:MBOAT-domain-containing protein [Daedalea quercina L-15889]|uniref:MBOAT-domain-containing protein n=1 Tax=Daedalea quercina L-15889 TaxID=1314783 RepID=A0A165SZ02_9APHY|nr:MBOAT-domain-containing protein [Daedalea quercina L-15889]
MDALFVPLAAAVGASLDQVKLISCLLVSYPLGSIFIRLPVSRPNIRHAFNVAVTSIYLLPILNMGTAYFQLLGDILFTYYVAAYVKSSKMPWIVFGTIMSHLTLNHIIRAILGQSYETYEITGPQMVLAMKLTTFAWSVFDGRRPVEELDKYQTEKRVTEYPSLLGFLGFAFYFPGFLVGPSLEYADYDILVHGTLFKQLEKKDDTGRGSRKLVPKGRKRVAYRRMFLGLALLGTYVAFAGSANLGVTVQDWYVQKGFVYRVAYLQFCGFIERTKYYAIWTLTEGASILTGLGFTGFNAKGKSTWKGAANVDMMNIEFAPNFKVLLDSWNIKTNVWLRECIYKRVTPKGKKPGFRSSMLTFATSAIWHGVQGGYYLTFAFGGFIQTAQRLCRRHIRPLFLPATYVTEKGAPPPPQNTIKRVYDIAGTFISILILNYTVIPFMLLDVRHSLAGWANLRWYGHWVVGGTLVFFYAGGTGLLKGLQAKRIRKAGLRADKEKDSDAVSVSDAPGAPVLPPFDDAAREFEDSDIMKMVNNSKRLG